MQVKGIIDMAVGMYEDACFLEAISTWDEDPKKREKADVAWSRYEGARVLLSMMFNLTEKQVDEEIEMLMTHPIEPRRA